MEPATRLLSLSFAMLIGCYVFGSIPLSVTLSEKSLRYTSITGAGLIVGTALSVIIPEGVHALYENKGPSHDHHHNHAHEPHPSNSAADKPKEKRDDTTAGASESSWIDFHQRLTTPPKLELHSMIGVSLTLGFVFMLIVDQLCGGAHSHNATNESSRHKSFTATLGLLVHAAADGVALGAAASSSRADVEMIVFVAIMLHKAPAAFGLSTFLLHEGFDRSRIRRHLLAFSIAAPLLAVITFYGLNQNEKEILSSYNATGLAMLFSAGTFLYVATVHILPELISRHQANNLDDKHGLTRREIVFLTAGILAPVFLGMYHKH